MNQRGEIKVMTIILLLALAAGIWMAIVLVPPYVMNFKVQNAVDTSAKFYTDPVRRNELDDFLRREDLDADLPIKTSEIKFDDSDATEIHVYADWEYMAVFIPPNPTGYTYERLLKFHDEATRPYKQ